MNKRRETLSLLFELSRMTRCCQEGSVICHDLTFHQFYVLDLIDREDVLEMSKLHYLLYIEKSTTTRLIEPLVKKGLIVKEKSIDDKRIINLRLTESGKQVCMQTWTCVKEFIDSVEVNIPDERRTEVFESLRILLRALRSFSTR